MCEVNILAVVLRGLGSPAFESSAEDAPSRSGGDGGCGGGGGAALAFIRGVAS